MEVDKAPADVLLQCPWLPVNISGCNFLAKSWFGDTAYHIMLTDTNCVWEERMDSATIQSRAQELNKRLRAPVRAFFSHLCEAVQPFLSGSNMHSSGEAQISLTRQEDGSIGLKLKSELAGLPFYWEFQCTPTSVTLVCVQLLRPLLAMSCVLQHQVEQLGDLLRRKDAEIQDYRENGATLSRERLQTDVFDEQTYRENFMAKTVPLLCSEQQYSPGFNSDLQHLYAAITSHGNAQKHTPSEDEVQTAAKEVKLAPSLNCGSIACETTGKDKDETQNGQSSTKAKMAERSGVKQPQKVKKSLSATSNPAERTSSKPKKKKVGLFG